MQRARQPAIITRVVIISAEALPVEAALVCSYGRRKQRISRWIYEYSRWYRRGTAIQLAYRSDERSSESICKKEVRPWLTIKVKDQNLQ